MVYFSAYKMAKKGLSERDITLFLNYNWDDSDHDGDLDDDDDVIEKILEHNTIENVEDSEQFQNNIDGDCEIDLVRRIIEEPIEEVDDNEPEEKQPDKLKKQNSNVYKWRKKAMEQVETNWKSELPEVESLIGTPLEYFMQFIDSEIVEKISEETNKYALQKGGTILKCTPNEIEQYIGCLLYFGVIKVPQFKMAWSKEMRIPLIADVMPRNRFDKIKQFIHFNDNTKQKARDHPEYDKLFKIRPLVDKLKNSYAKIPPEEFQAVDEQIIPFKGKKMKFLYNF